MPLLKKREETETRKIYLNQIDLLPYHFLPDTKIYHFIFSECYQIRKMDAKATKKLVSMLIETVFETLSTPIKVDKNKGKRWKVWLEDFWSFIMSRFKDDIDFFADLPLFPIFSKRAWLKVQSFCLYALSDNLLFPVDQYGKEISAEYCYLFELLSMNVINSIPDWMDMKAVEKFLYKCTGPNLAALMGKLSSSNVKYFNKEATSTQKCLLLTFIAPKFTADMLGDDARNAISGLELFKEKTSCSSDFKLVSAKSSMGILGCENFPVAFPRPLLQLDPVEGRFADIFGVKQLSRESLILDTLQVLETYSLENAVTFVHWILTNRYHDTSNRVTKLLTSIEFLKVNEKLLRPCELFDPSDNMLKTLFTGFDVFPTDIRFTEEKMICTLRDLGLKTKADLAVEDIYDICKRIHNYGSYKRDYKIALAVLKFLNSSENKILLQKVQVSTLKWIPIRDENKTELLQYNKGRDALVSPLEIRSVEFRDIIGSVVPLMDCKKYNQVAKHFKWTRKPDLEDVAGQLHNIVQHYTSRRKAEFLHLVTAIYAWFYSLNSPCEVEKVLNETFSDNNFKYIWTGFGFVSPKAVTVNKLHGDIDLKPFLWVLPNELMHLKEFFLKIGCRKNVDTPDYINILAQIKNDSDKSKLEYTSDLLQLAINILNKIKDKIEHGKFKDHDTIYVPVQSDRLLMMPASDCTYGHRDESMEEGLLCVHEDVPVSTAEAVGVQSFKQQMMSELEALEEWGQTEPLTRRLHNLLKEGYVDGFSVPKELFQNADDAKATKLWILYDERDNIDLRTDLLNNAMSEVQGPAVWVYNDAVFTEADFKNITKLSGATKQADTSKIGKFGLGFCSVYNLTDVPSFLSGESLVIFDPHTTYLGKALPGKSPGLRIKLNNEKNRRMVKRLRNQFKPFEDIFGCEPLHESIRYNGTLFRLPLRNKKGQISDIIYRNEEIKDLLCKVKEFSSNLLIFSQSVTEFKLFHLKNECQPQEIQLVFDCHKSTQLRLPETLGCNSVLSEASEKKQENYLKTEPLKIIEKIAISTSFADQSFKADTKWLVSWATGTEERTLQMSKENEGALPLAAVSVSFESSGNTYKVKNMDELPYCFYQKSHFFCFLPLPVEHNCQFHINGLFSVSSDRRRLLSAGAEDKNYAHQKWNERLMSDSVVKAFVLMLENLRTLGSVSKDTFYTLWPKPDQNKLTGLLSRSFYEFIVENDSEVMEKNSKWYRISECIFIDPNLREHEDGDLIFQVLDMFSTDAVAIDLPASYYEYLYNVKKETIKEKTVYREEFFLQYFFPNIASLSTSSQQRPSRNTLLKHAVLINNSKVDKWIKENASLPTKPNDMLRLPSETVDKNSEVGDLFTDTDGRFLLDDFNSLQSIRLGNLGVIQEVLPDTIVVERAERIQKLNQKCEVCALHLCKKFLLYICEKESSHDAVWPDLRSIEFLPVANRPKNWQSAWEADKFTDDTKKKTKLCKDHKEEKAVRRNKFERAPVLYRSSLEEYVGCNFLVLDAEPFQKVLDVSKLERLLVDKLDMKSMRDVRIEIAIQQLLTFAESFNGQSDQIGRHVDHVVRTIYRFLDGQDAVSTFDFPDGAMIWTSKVFTYPSKVAITNFNLDCSPFLFHLEKSSLKDYRKLCKALKIDTFHSPDNIILELRKISDQSDENPVKTENRKAVINLIESLRSVLEVNNLTYNHLLTGSSHIIYVPDTQWILRDSRALCFNDDSELEIDETMMLVNEDLKIKTAKAVGIKSKLAQVIQDTSDSVGFFQEEPLVTRLNNILSGYPCDNGIFKELIQNADDAGAVEIHFLLDFNTYGTNVFDRPFEKLQGPALCIFNDKPFTQRDLIGIQSLGKGSKGDDPSKTGQYGVGFNSVYNLTDAPSFLTKGPEIENGETLCIFDPMAMFLQSIYVSREKPGRRFKDVNTIRKKHADVLQSYNEDYFSMEKQGTVFRLPLRMGDKGYNSEIKDENVSTEIVYQMLKDFHEEASEALVFLKHLGKIKISVKKDTTFTLMMTVETAIEEKDREKRNLFFEKRRDMCEKFKVDRSSLFSQPKLCMDYQITSCVEDTESKTCHTREYIVIQGVGFANYKPPSVIQEKCKTGELGLLPQGGVACIVSEKGNSKIKNVSRKGKAFCFLPLPGETGLPVHINGHFALDQEGRRGLWKSDNFEETVCHKTLWNKCLIEGVVVPTYLHLLEVIKEKCSSNTKSDFKIYSIIKDTIAEYFSYFPIKDRVLDDYWLLLLKLVYKEAVGTERVFLPKLIWSMTEKQNASSVLKAQLTWIPLKRACWGFPAYSADTLLDYQSTYEKDEEKRSLKLTSILTGIGMNIVSVPRNIIESLHCADVPIEALIPPKVIDFLGSHDQTLVDCCKIKPGSKVEDTVIKSEEHMKLVVNFCLKDKEHFFKNLYNLPVFITTDNVVRLISTESPVFVTHFNDFFENLKSKFLCSSLAKLFLNYKKNPAMQNTALKPFLLQDFKDLLTISPFSFLKTGEVYNWHQDNPTIDWISKFWNFFSTELKNRTGEDKITRDVKKTLKHLGEIALIPGFKSSIASPEGEWFLVPPCKLDVTMDLSDFQSGDLKTALQKLNLISVSSDVIAGSDSEKIFRFIKEQGPNSKRPERVVACLYLIRGHIPDLELSVTDAKAILTYLSENCSAIQNVVPELRNLPLFITHEGSLISPSQYSKVISVQDKNFPADGLSIFSQEMKVAFLRTLKDVTKLYKVLGVISKSPEDIYIEMILPSQWKLNRDDFYKHIDFISQKIFSLQDYLQQKQSPKKQKIVDLLKSSQFIETRPNRYACISELYNPRIKIFKMFCSKEELLPPQFDKDYFMNLFEFLGMKNQMTVELLEKFAKDVSVKGKGGALSQSVKNQSGRLLKTFIEMKQELQDKPGLEKFARIPFIIPCAVPHNLSSIFKPFLEEERMVCFSESVFYDKLEIAWTACPVLPEALNIGESIKQRLEAKPAVFEKCFVSHCRNVGQNLSEVTKKPLEKDFNVKIDSVMHSIYEHLSEMKTKDALKGDTIKQLAAIPMVYFRDENLICKANQVAISCNDYEEIPPFFRKLPIHLGKYHEVFKSLGSAATPSVKSYIQVLQYLKEECKHDEMLAPDVLIAKKAICNLFTHYLKGTEKIVEKGLTLYLPTVERRLDEAKSVVICNNNYYRRRIGNNRKINYFIGLDKLEIKNIAEDQCNMFFKELPEKLRPTFLTDIVEEVVNLTNMRTIPDSRTRNAEMLIRSTSFRQGLIRLLKHTHNENRKPLDSKLEMDVQEKLGQISLLSVTGMSTSLQVKVYENGEYKTPKIVPNTEEAKLVHIDIDGKSTKVYVEIGNPEWQDDLSRKLVGHLNDFLNNCLKHDLVLILLDFFKYTSRPSQIADMLDKKRIVNHSFTSSEDIPLFPKPGTLVPEKYHQFLDNDYSCLYEYEFSCVAYELDDPLIEGDTDTDVRATYVFARILSKIESEGASSLFLLYEVDIGEDEPIKVPAYRLFKFVRKSNTSTELVLFEGPTNETVGEQSLPPDDDTSNDETEQTEKEELSIHSICKEIKECLIEAWKQDERTRKGIVKRLCFKWHPDKNPDKINFCTKVFQYIQQCIHTLEDGGMPEDYCDGTEDASGGRTATDSSSRPNRSSGSRGWRYQSGDDGFWGSFFEQFERQQFRDTHRGRRRDSGFYFDFEESESNPYPWPHAARKWQRQAKSDLCFGTESLENKSAPYNWICYIFHQVRKNNLFFVDFFF